MKLGDKVKFYAGAGTIVGFHGKGKTLVVKGARPAPYFVKAKTAVAI